MPSATLLLKRLEALRLAYGEPAAARKLALLGQLRQRRFKTAASLVRYHEALCWLVAYPDDAKLLAAARAELTRFAQRADLAQFRSELFNSGIAGTVTYCNFFWMMSHWLAREFPDRLKLDWVGTDFETRLRSALPLLPGWGQAEAAKRSDLPVRKVLDRLRGDAPDAVWLVKAIGKLPGSTFTHEQLHDSIDPAYALAPGPAFPSRTAAQHPRAPLVFRSTPPPASRPDLACELARAPLGQRLVQGKEARALVALARGAMLTRARDLVAFSWGDELDVMLVDDGDGLSFALIGSVPERRLPLPAVHGWLMLRNRAPVGYVQTDSLLRGSEVAFNLFPSFRGGEAAYLFARVLAVSRWVLGAEAFSIEPYQLGEGNEEGIESGAWWFYYKMGFRPIAAAPRRLLQQELARMQARPGYRSTPEILRQLAAGHMVYEPRAGSAAGAGAQRAWLPWLPAMGLALPLMPEKVAAEQARRRYGAAGLGRWSAPERMAWQRMAPVLMALPGVERWSPQQRSAAVAAVLAKGGARELAYLQQVNQHAALCKGLEALARAAAAKQGKF